MLAEQAVSIGPGIQNVDAGTSDSKHEMSDKTASVMASSC
jgi:hypothetical protein